MSSETQQSSSETQQLYRFYQVTDKSTFILFGIAEDSYCNVDFIRTVNFQAQFDEEHVFSFPFISSQRQFSDKSKYSRIHNIINSIIYPNIEEFVCYIGYLDDYDDRVYIEAKNNVYLNKILDLTSKVLN